MRDEGGVILPKLLPAAQSRHSAYRYKHKNLPTTVAYFMGFEKRHPCRPDCPKQPKIENSCWKCVSRSIYVSSNLWLKMGLPFSAFFLLKAKCKQRSGSLWKLCGDNSSLNQIFKFRNKICLILTSFYTTFQCGRYNIFKKRF